MNILMYNKSSNIYTHTFCLQIDIEPWFTGRNRRILSENKIQLWVYFYETQIFERCNGYACTRLYLLFFVLIWTAKLLKWTIKWQNNIQTIKCIFLDIGDWKIMTSMLQNIIN